MITVQMKEDYLLLSFNYYPGYISRVKKLPGALSENENDTLWSIEIDTIDTLIRKFKGELFFKTPLHVIKGEKAPTFELKLKNKYDIPKLNEGITPYKYQEFGYQFILNKLFEHSFCILGDSVGLGKTIMAIMSITTLIREGKISKVLILCKKSLKRQWSREFDKFTNLRESISIEYIKEKANKKQREAIYKDFKKGILITTYESCMHDGEELKSLGFDLMVIDEVHTLKKKTGTKNKSVKEVGENIKYKILMTGTPITNKPLDLYAITSLASSSYFDMKVSDFQKRYVVGWRTRKTYLEVGFKNIEELREKCQSIMLRRTENEIALELPKVHMYNTYVSIDGYQEQLNFKIKEMLAQVFSKEDSLDENDEEYETKAEKLEAQKKGILGLRQIVANDPKIFRYSKSFLAKNLIDDYSDLLNYEMSAKTKKVIELVTEIKNQGRKVIIFSKYERCVLYLRDVLENISKVQIYTGQLKEEERETAIDKFVEEEDQHVLIATNACCEGVNGQVANNIINYDLPDTVAIGIQRMGRARRVGSEFDKVYVYNLITEDTVDQKVSDKLKRQKELFNSIVELTSEQSIEIKKLSN